MRLAEIRAEAARRVPEWEPWMTELVGFGGAGVFCYSHWRWESAEYNCRDRDR